MSLTTDVFHGTSCEWSLQWVPGAAEGEFLSSVGLLLDRAVSFNATCGFCDCWEKLFNNASITIHHGTGAIFFFGFPQFCKWFDRCFSASGYSSTIYATTGNRRLLLNYSLIVSSQKLLFLLNCVKTHLYGNVEFQKFPGVLLLDPLRGRATPSRTHPQHGLRPCARSLRDRSFKLQPPMAQNRTTPMCVL